MRWLVLVALASCGPPNVLRKKDGSFDIHGNVKRHAQHCGHPEKPEKYPGAEVLITQGGKEVARPKADQYGKFVVNLKPGEYCVRPVGSDDCFTRWELPEKGDPKKEPVGEIVVNEYDMKGCN